MIVRLPVDGSVESLLSQLLHTMLLIIEHSRGKGEFAGHSYLSERNDYDAFGVLGLDATDDAAHITEVRDFRDCLDGLEDYRFLFRASCSISSGIKATS